jgi:hypothetical protein
VSHKRSQTNPIPEQFGIENFFKVQYVCVHVHVHFHVHVHVHVHLKYSKVK